MRKLNILNIINEVFSEESKCKTEAIIIQNVPKETEAEKVYRTGRY